MKKPTSKKPSSKKPAGAKPSLLQVIISALEDLKAQNILTLDVTRLTDVTDTLIIASGSSSRQVRALAQHAVEEAKKQGMPSIGIEGLDGGEWVLADFGDVVLHVMQPDVREFYDLEKLWQSTEPKSAPVTQAAPASKSASVSKTAPAAKPAAKKPATTKKADVKTAPAPVIEFTTQSDAAKARKAPGKPKAAPSSAASPKKPATKTAPVKAGIYAKTGTKKPAAKKPATTVKKSTTDAKKPAAAKKPTVAVKKPTGAVKKPAVAAKKPAARKPRPA